MPRPFVRGMTRKGQKIIIVGNGEELLKSIYAAGRDFKSYISICDETELLPVDCEILAGMLLSRRKNRPEALKWVENGT